jgi:DNA-binding XRE family transcriptional regulator
LDFFKLELNKSAEVDIIFLYMDYASLLKAIRNEELLSQTELAKKLGVSYVSVNRWENGKHEPSYKIKRKIIRICKERGINVSKGDKNGAH